MDIDFSFVSHVGCCRTENQDSYGDLSQNNVFVIADGMGGHQDGALASQLAVKAFSYQSDHDATNTTEYIRQAHQLILRATDEKRRYFSDNSMGTTGVVMYVHPIQQNYIVSWCGDSRMYHFIEKEKRLVQVTVDHSYVQELVDRGVISAQEALNHPKKNVITHAIGVGPLEELRIDTRKRGAQDGDILILCTDGLSNEVSHEEMEDLCTHFQSSQQLCEALVQRALDQGGRDNVTVCVVRFVPFD